MIAVLRPDFLGATAERFSGLGPVWAAAELGEIRALREKWRRKLREDAP
jgi:hypothetical protein